MNKTADYRFTIISPVFNEEGNIARLAETLDKYINSSEDKSACVLSSTTEAQTSHWK